MILLLPSFFLGGVTPALGQSAVVLNGTWSWTEQNGNLIRPTGNVGIGISTDPTAKLQVESGANGQILLLRGTSGTTAGYISISTGVKGSGKSMELTTSDGVGNQASRLVIEGGTNNPAVTIYQGASGAETPLTTFTSTGVGIGTTTPTAPLDVAGNANISGSLTVSGNLNVSGTISGSGLNNLNASNLTTGTVPTARMSGTYPISVTGNAGTSTKLATPVTLGVTGDATGSVGFDGSTATYIPVTIGSIGTPGTYTKITTNAQGRVISGSGLSASDIPSLDASKITTGRLAVGVGGTGTSTAPTSGQLLIGNSSGTYTPAALSSGAGISVTGGSGSLSIANTGVVSLAGTANQVNVSAATGAVTLSLPQNINSTATPTFSGMTLNGGLSATSATLQSNGLIVGTNQLVVSGGNVGIGTATPSTALDVAGYIRSSGNTANLTLDGSNLTATERSIYFNESGVIKGLIASYPTVNGGHMLIVNRGNSYMGFGTNNTERVRIDATGKVGVGTTTPAAQLDVANGGLRIGGGSLAGSGLSLNYDASGGHIQTYSSLPLTINELGNSVIINPSIGNVGIGTSSPAYKLDVNGTMNLADNLTLSKAGPQFITKGNDSANYVVVSGGTSTTGANISLYGATNATPNITVFKNGTTESMRITSAGSLGVGTTTPTQKLDVAGSGNFSGNLTLGGLLTMDRIAIQDTRAVATGPSMGGPGVRFDLKSNATDGLSDGGNFHGVMTIQQWSDSSGGGTRQLGFTDNNNLWIRGSGSALTAYNAWKRIIDSSSIASYAPTLTGTGASGTWGISITGNAGTVTNGLYSTGSYANPAWLTSIDASKITTGVLAVARGGTGTTTSTGSGSVVLQSSPALTGIPIAPTAVTGTNTTQIATTNFVNNQIESKLAGSPTISSPSLTGIPIAPTAVTGTNTTQIATTNFVNNQIESKLAGSPTISSPSLTGIPIAPTATIGTNTTQLATTNFVNNSISQALSNSPSLGGIPSAATAVTGTNTTQIATTNFVNNQIGSTLAGSPTISSPSLTGIPTAPTAVTGTNTTQIATTNFVNNQIGSSLANSPTISSANLTGTPIAPTAATGTNTNQVATTLFVNNQVNSKLSNSPSLFTPTLLSPSLTGTPVAPTAATGTNTTQVATTAFVNTHVTSILSNAPSIASANLTGTPVAITAATGTNTTQLATTAFVNNQINSSAPTKTGGGASGTWGISITGTAANVTGTVAVANGGTGAATAASARANLGAAASGVNTDITSVSLAANGLTVGGTQLVASGGKVGIGATPSYMLDVNAGAGNNTAARFTNGTGSLFVNFSSSAAAIGSDAAGGNSITFNPATNAAWISTNGSTKLYIDSSGNTAFSGGISVSKAGTAPSDFVDILNSNNAAGAKAGMRMRTAGGWATSMWTEQGNWWHAFGDTSGNIRWGYDGTNLKVGSNTVVLSAPSAITANSSCSGYSIGTLGFDSTGVIYSCRN